MSDFITWFKKNFNEEIPVETDMSWWSKRGLPMIVHCTYCETTMALPSAFIDEEGYTYCGTCAGKE